MLRTRLCDLLGIDVPIILAGMGAGATSAEFAAAVSNEGGLGSVGSLFRSADVVKRDIDLLTHPDQPQLRDQSHSAKPWTSRAFGTPCELALPSFPSRWTIRAI